MRAGSASGFTASRREADSSSEVTCAHFGGIDTHEARQHLMSRMQLPKLLSRPQMCEAKCLGQYMKHLPLQCGRLYSMLKQITGA